VAFHRSNVVVRDDCFLGELGAALCRVRLVLLPEALALVRRGDRRIPDGGGDDPVRLGDELLRLPFPLHEERERRRLHSTDGEELPPAHPAREGQEPREDGAPGEVDLLPRPRGRRQPIVEVREVPEGLLDVPAAERAEPCTLDSEAGGDIPGDAHGLRTDELTLAVEVRRDYDLVRVHRQRPDRVPDRRLADLFHGFGGEERVEVRGVPVTELWRVVDLDDVSTETDHRVVDPVPRELEDGHALAAALERAA